MISVLSYIASQNIVSSLPRPTKADAVVETNKTPLHVAVNQMTAAEQGELSGRAFLDL